MQGDITNLKETVGSMTGSSNSKCASDICELRKKLEKAEEDAKKAKLEAEEKLKDEKEE